MSSYEQPCDHPEKWHQSYPCGLIRCLNCDETISECSDPKCDVSDDKKDAPGFPNDWNHFEPIEDMG